MFTRTSIAFTAAIVVNASVAFAVATPAIAQSTVSPTARQAEVERRGTAVMPFDQKRTMHLFRQTPSGGVQMVMSTDGDSAQIELIRSHLRQEAANFAGGDYSDPIAIHDAQMPGLALLRTAGQKIVIAYQELPEGAQITFTTSDPVSLKALHDWFAAQVSDHGSHAMMMK